MNNSEPANPGNLRRVSAVFAVLAITGVIPWLTRYGAISQWILLFHIALGLAAVVPLIVIICRHARRANESTPTRWWNPGLWSGVGWLLLAGTGLWLAGTGVWGVFVPYRLHTVHLAAGTIIAALGFLHIAYGLAHTTSPQHRHAQLLRPLVLLLIVAGAGAVLAGMRHRQQHLSMGDFTPSNARTDTGRVLPADLYLHSDSCGASGCHSTIYAEWMPSAHHFSGADPFYEMVKGNYVEAQGKGAGKYCAGCHEPISLLSGNYIPPRTAPTSQAGSSCTFCHVLRKLEVRGNANYVAAVPSPYLFEFSSSPALRRVAQMLIRLYPDQHRRDYDVRPAQTMEFCGTCHKQYLDKRVNGWGFVQLQNQYDDLKNGPWHTDPTRGFVCQSCHMREERSDDPARNVAGYIHDHRILASNTFVPELLHLPGADQQIALVQQWLSGKTVIPEIAKTWPAGPIISVSLQPETPLAAGREANIDALVINTKVVHTFPTGPVDLIQSWLEFTATDDQGRVVYSAGTLAPNGHVEGNTVQYRAHLLNRQGETLYDHALWNAVGARDKRAILPGASDTAQYSFPVPRGLTGSLHCKLRLLYRKFNDQALATIFANHTPPPVPVTELSSATLDLPIAGGASRVATGEKRAAIRRVSVPQMAVGP